MIVISMLPNAYCLFKALITSFIKQLSKVSEINAEEINRFNWFVDSFRAKGGFEKEWK